MTPTQRTLAECKRRGWIAAVVEKWNPHARIRQDLFGCIDIVAIVPALPPKRCTCCAYMAGECMCGAWDRDRDSTIIGIQACSGTDHARRRTKALAEPRLKAWLEAGARFEIWSFSKRGAQGKRKLWQLRAEAVHASDFALAGSSLPAAASEPSTPGSPAPIRPAPNGGDLERAP